jgi:hypothetical protein
LKEVTLDEFEFIFVNQFDKSETRRLIFDNYLLYCQDLKKTIGIGFNQWIDGSFVSNKVNPQDMDFITFFDSKIYSQFESEIDSRFGKWKVNNFYDKLDAYTIRQYPIGHKFYPIFQADCAYWYDWFSNSKLNRVKKRFPKGFIQIKIT